MKHIFTAVLFACSALSGTALAGKQPNSPIFKVEDGLFIYEKVIETELTKKEAVAYSAAFIAEKFKSAKIVIELRDEDLGKLVGTVILKDRDARVLAAFKAIQARIVIDAKDGRVRLQAMNIVGIDGNDNLSPWGEIESANQYRVEPLAVKILHSFEADLTSYLGKAKASAAW